MPTFDPVVFDSTIFDATFGVPALLKVQVDPIHRHVVSGDIVVITVYIITISDPRRRYLFNPDQGVKINVFYPDKSVKISNAAMSNVDTGIYQYRIQTGAISDNTVFDENVFDTMSVDPVGVYTVHFTARDGNISMQTVPQEVYSIIEG